ncbi:MAG: hypothetical protein WC449_04245 [Candidatus Paceibacterota bacterium]
MERILDFNTKKVVCSKNGHDLFDMVFTAENGETFEYTGINQKPWSVIFALKETRISRRTEFDVVVVESFVPFAQKRMMRLPAISFSSKNLGPIKAAAKALRKRTGYECDEKNIIPLSPVLMSSTHSETQIYCFLAERCVKREEIVSEFPFYPTVHWMSFNLWLDMIKLNKIIESSSIMATHLAMENKPELYEYRLEYLDNKKNMRD